MEVITFGETMVLFNPEAAGPLRYVHQFSKSIAGAESNVAIALARLGHRVGWFSKLGEDEFGRYIQSVVRGEGVDVSRVILDPKGCTGLVFKERFAHANPNIYYYRRHSAASQLAIGDIDLDYLASCKVLHVTGITPALSTVTRRALFYALDGIKERGVTISFDPNLRLKLWPVEEARGVLLQLAQRATIIFPGIDEGKHLVKTDDPQEIAQAFMEIGCRIVATKLGKEGCHVTDGTESHTISGYIIERPEDTVGAGDGFAAGFLSGILRGYSLEHCGQLANGVGAMATLVRGDMEGFPTWAQVQEFMGISEYIDR